MALRTSKVAAFLLTLIATVCLSAVFAACNREPAANSDAPVYTGMTITSTPPRQPDAKIKNVREGVYKTDIKASDNDTDTPFGETDIEDKIDSEFAVTGGTKDIFYANANADAYVSVHVNNPSNYEIQSFTLNGEKYSSYMFEKGSDMENLILKIKLGDLYGIKDYTIDAIKYIDGTEIKDVKIGGNKTVKVGVYNENAAPQVTAAEDIKAYEIALKITVTDAYNVIPENAKLTAVLYDGETVLKSEMSSFTDNIKFAANSSKTYQYAIVCVYDNYNGKGENANILYKKTINTPYIVNIGETDVAQQDLKFTLEWNPSWENKNFTSLTLWQYDKKIKDFVKNEDNTYVATHLEPDTKYIVELCYLNNTAEEVIYYEFEPTLPAMSEGLWIENGVVRGPGSWEGETLYLNAPVAANAFMYCNNIKTLYLGNGVTSIGDNAFDYCPLNDIYISNEVTNLGNVFGYLWMGLKPEIQAGYKTNFNEIDGALYLGNFANPCHMLYLPVNNIDNLNNITEFNVSEDVKVIASGAFSYCTKLTSLVIPDSVVSIGYMALAHCDSLTTLTVPFIGNKDYTPSTSGDSMKIFSLGYLFGIENDASDSEKIPKQLSNVIVTGGTIIVENAFKNFSSVTKIILPNSLKQVQSSAFNDCTNLTDVYFTGTQEDWNKIQISNTGNDALLNAAMHFNHETPTI